jgi:hypothetical protein
MLHPYRLSGDDNVSEAKVDVSPQTEHLTRCWAVVNENIRELI